MAYPSASPANSLHASRWAPSNARASTSSRSTRATISAGSDVRSSHGAAKPNAPNAPVVVARSRRRGDEAREKISDDLTLQSISEVANMDVERVDPSVSSIFFE